MESINKVRVENIKPLNILAYNFFGKHRHYLKKRLCRFYFYSILFYIIAVKRGTHFFIDQLPLQAASFL